MTRTRIALALAALALGAACTMPDKDESGSVSNGQPGAPAPALTSAKAVVPTGPMTSIPEGTWTVGVDVVAGTYRAVGAGSMCYWSITKSGSNGSDIQDNHYGGGNLTVTLKAGQDFTTNNCPDWAKQS